MSKIIEVDLTKKEYVYEKYNKDLVSKDLINYLVSSAPKANVKEKVKIVINNQTNAENLPTLIKKSLLKEYNESLNIKNHNDIIQLIFLIVGVIVLFLSTLITENVLKEIILIGGWVLIGSLIELEIFTDSKERHRRLILKKLLKSEIIEKK